MPMQHVALATGAVAAVTLVVGVAIVIYEIPEVRRYTEDVRRRVAMMFESARDSEHPPYRPPRFNRPEDADGFFLSRCAGSAEPGVDADEESLRRQREELLHWNAVRLEKQRQSQSREFDEKFGEKMSASVHDQQRPDFRHRGSSFDDFLRPDESGEKGSYVFNSGADVNNHAGLLRHRGGGGSSAVQGFAAASGAIELKPMPPMPMAEERHADLHGIGEDATRRQIPVPPEKFEIMSDIYSATTVDREEEEERHALLAPTGPDAFFTPLPTPTPATEVSATVGRELTSSPSDAAVPPTIPQQDERLEVFASIQAWAHDSSRDFYSPLPVTPVAPVSEPELLSEGGFSEDFSDAGEMTPIDTLSLAGSGEDVGNMSHVFERSGTGSGTVMDAHNELLWQHPAEEGGGRPFDVLSESEGMATPASWSEVGSVISETEAFATRP